MKKKILLLTFCFTINLFGQKNFSTEKDVFSSRKIFFYGYDFSDFQLADTKRMGQDLKNYLFVLTGFLDEHLPEKKLKKWIDKDTIVYNYNPTVAVNKKIKSDAIGTFVKHSINKDSLQFFINKYNISDKEGIGYVIIFECFDNASKSVSCYEVFFDIGTKKIISYDYAISRDGNSYNRISDWSSAAFIAVKKLADTYKSNQEKFKKLNK